MSQHTAVSPRQTPFEHEAGEIRHGDRRLASIPCIGGLYHRYGVAA